MLSVAQVHLSAHRVRAADRVADSPRLRANRSRRRPLPAIPSPRTVVRSRRRTIAVRLRRRGLETVRIAALRHARPRRTLPPQHRHLDGTARPPGRGPGGHHSRRQPRRCRPHLAASPTTISKRDRATFASPTGEPCSRQRFPLRKPQTPSSADDVRSSDDHDLADEVRAEVAGTIPVTVAPTPELNELFQILIASMPAPSEDEPSYFAHGRISPNAVDMLFTASGFLFAITPWSLAQTTTRSCA